MRRVALIFAWTLLAAACSEPSPDPAAVAAARQRAETAAASLTGALLAELSAALAAGPAHEAVQVCATAAQPIAERARAEHGMRIGRTALRVRNLRNAPDAAERAVLERWAADPAAADWSEVVAGEDGPELRWMRPIRLMPLCSQCHGDPATEIAPATLEAIRRLYPEDRATGFAVGELRGAVSARVPL